MVNFDFFNLENILYACGTCSSLICCKYDDAADDLTKKTMCILSVKTAPQNALNNKVLLSKISEFLFSYQNILKKICHFAESCNWLIFKYIYRLAACCNSSKNISVDHFVQNLGYH